MNGKRSLSSMDIWKLSFDYSVIDAAILITGNDPDNYYENREGEMVKSTHYEGYEAALNFIKRAIITNKLNAIISFKIDNTNRNSDYNDLKAIISTKDAIEITDGSRNIFKMINWKSTNFSIWVEPDWENTLVSKDDIKELLSSQGVYPPFFFPNGDPSDLSNSSGPRYSPKLDCAVAAWNSYRDFGRSLSVKEQIRKWVNDNGALYNLINDQGDVPAKTSEDIATIVNWDTKGGAPKTGGGS